jgi:hypothetical protein
MGPSADEISALSIQHRPVGMMLQPEFVDRLTRWRESRTPRDHQPSVSHGSMFPGRSRAAGSTCSASASTRGWVGKARRWCSSMDTECPAHTCSRSRSRSRPPSRCSHRTCPATGVVRSPPPHSAFRILPQRWPGGWMRPDSSVRRSWRTRWAARSSPSSPCTCRDASGRWCSSVRRSIPSGAPPATSFSAVCVTQRANRGRCFRSLHVTTSFSASARSWRPLDQRSPTGSSSACR